MKRIKVLLVDDHAIIRNSLRSIIENEECIEVTGEAQEGIEALEKVQKLHPHVVVMDITMPGMNGLEATQQIKKKYPEIMVLILSMHSNQEYIFQTLRAGASGYLIKKSASEELIEAIYAAMRGLDYLSSVIFKIAIESHIHYRAKTNIEDNLYDELNDDERGVLQLAIEGDSTLEISEKLNINKKTVETYKSKIVEKLSFVQDK